eukprot:COSAG06_NODE_5198_length_3644_cov_8.858674_6_plen_70_part_00
MGYLTITIAIAIAIAISLPSSRTGQVRSGFLMPTMIMIEDQSLIYPLPRLWLASFTFAAVISGGMTTFS